MSRLGSPNGTRKYKVGEIRTTPARRKETLAKYNNSEKRKSAMREYYAKNKDQSANKAMMKNYGITLTEYNTMLTEQKDCCYICKIHKDTQVKRLHIDHNHKTGKVRALLCHYCNATIGNAREDMKRLTNIITYLKEFN